MTMFQVAARQDGFISSEVVYGSVIPKNHILIKVEENVDFSFVNDLLKETYSPDNGRPTTNYPSRMLKALWV